VVPSHVKLAEKGGVGLSVLALFGAHLELQTPFSQDVTRWYPLRYAEGYRQAHPEWSATGERKNESI